MRELLNNYQAGKSVYFTFKTKLENWLYFLFRSSYKLWSNYLKMRRAHLKPKCINDPEYEEVNDIYERCLASMNKVTEFLDLKFIIFVSFLIFFSLKDAKNLDGLLSIPFRSMLNHSYT